MKGFIFLFFIVFNISLGHSQTEKYQELMSQDWANLEKYREANQEIIASGNFPEVVFMGNSITEGWTNLHPEFFEKHNFIGRGIGGQTTPQMLIRFTPDVIDLNPKLVVILAGTNDIAGNTGFSSKKMITDNIKAMVQLAQQNNIKVILSSILPVYDYPWRPGLEPVSRISEINKWMENYARENEISYLDYFSHLSNSQKGMKKEFADDGVHPTEAGYKIMEPLVLEAIKDALKTD
ncbi:SGNH/GDSL hydrolase family protein [Christiangramia sp. SM2212]|uniref:SGNH/GDSL hydrolase family protein n=1 Tax=Christiangramia sediminicola TaxID=3073267 RepID=A0ABU1EKZ7_9FLAO|nr:SGNH/GDSL hydrolase family protein [Christiangramia sp. SM2212]MDR5589046.1 SGNH/GDSL hydrolase family protein [Christiangramia sp. SM2212]